MQDVKLVAGSNGHLAQCPSAEPDCPTCGQFQTLQSVVARLEKSLQQLTDKVMISFAFCFASLVTIRRRNFFLFSSCSGGCCANGVQSVDDSGAAFVWPLSASHLQCSNVSL